MHIKTTDTKMSVRTLNVLCNIGITDCHDLMQLEISELNKCRNCGEKTIKEITRYQRILKSLHKDITDLLIFNPKEALVRVT